MGFKLKMVEQKIGPIEKGEDGFYREAGGHIVICHNVPETWYRPDEPGTKEEQWAEIEAAFAAKNIRRLKQLAVAYGAWTLVIIIALLWAWFGGN